MDALRNKRLRRRIGKTERRSALLVVGFGFASAAAAPLPVATLEVPRSTLSALASAEIELFLEVSLNGMARGLKPFTERAGELWASAEVLRQLGFVLPDGVATQQRLRALPDVVVNYDVQRQRIEFTAPLAMLQLPTTVVGAPGVVERPAVTSTGLLLNYDLYGTQNSGASLGLFTELRAFSGESVFSATDLLQHAKAQSGSTQQARSVRLDTTWSRSFADQMLTLRVGDTVTGALPWSRATRIGGIQLARNFGLQPYRQTAPLPGFIGSATLPSQVELFVNGIRQFNGQVPAGPFQLNTLPSVNGAGTAQVVLTDALGRATTLDFSLYDAGRLLAPGLTDWTVDLGVVRRNYGLRSLDYGRELLLSGTYRRGLSDRFTLEGHAEAMRGLVLAGVGGVQQLGGAGLISGSLARSQHSAGSGMQGSLSWSWIQNQFNAGLSGTRTQGDYRDAATQYGASPPKASARATVGYSAGEWGSFNLSYFLLQPVGEARTRYASLNWSRSIGRVASLSVGMNQNLSKRQDRGVFVTLNWLLDTRTSAGVSFQHDAQAGTSGLASVQQSPGNEGGWGWRAAARVGGTSAGGQGEVNYLGRYGRVQAGVSDFGNGSRYGYAGASGSMVLMGGHGFAARRIDGAFAVVDTDGVPGVPVKLENRLMGQTDERGLMLVVPVNAYQNNKLAIDPMQLPADLRVGRAEALFTPSDRAGSRVRFDITPVRAANVALVDGEGRPLAMGSQVKVNGRSGEGEWVGYDGLVYLEDLSEDNSLAVHTPEGLCKARFAWGKSPTGVAQIGPLACLP
ncbi:fimbria/pilus outer membrane usher protein [Ottowia thiooxydans]|uniref:fimbria/pilus outer membrane usher protein n=1 Tax=Ottowia thiooxydans TaxID=219182 RepID=UPI0004120906|nr:fimbria/pilus outer membrane usher protein [Ottowia thiooxydans]